MLILLLTLHVFDFLNTLNKAFHPNCHFNCLRSLRFLKIEQYYIVQYTFVRVLLFNIHFCIVLANVQKNFYIDKI